MAWDFETDPEFQKELDWIDAFVRAEVEPLDLILGSQYDVKNPDNIRLVRPLQAQVKARKLWACHLGPELGGQGYGQVKLALINEILGRSRFAPVVFGCHAPDSGNAEILAHYGTPEQKDCYLAPLLNNEIVSCFSMTEPQGGADPTQFVTRAVRDGSDWVITGEKWFSSHALYADFLLVLAVTDPDAEPHRRMSMFIVPRDAPGLEIVRNTSVAWNAPVHSYVRYNGVRAPVDHMLGEEGGAFVVAQVRLGGGRIHHAMRTIGKAREALDFMCRRAVSRFTQGSVLADKQMVQEKIADSWMELEQFRLLVLRTAWLVDKHKDYKAVRKDISAIKALMPKVLHDVASRALHIHGSLGVSNEMPFASWVMDSYHLALADGPTEVHKVVVAKQLLRDYRGVKDPAFPDYHLPAARDAAAAKFAGMLAADEVI